ncbi:MAG: PilZ domain-containing protein [Terriglobales bacterium]
MQVTRAEPRTRHESPVRIFGMDGGGRPINVGAFTMDVSRHGARLKGIHPPCWDTPGETIGVRYGTEKARFKVVWIGSPGTASEGQVGIYCVEQGKYIWGIAAPDTARPPASAAAITTIGMPAIHLPIGLSPLYGGKNNRRKDARYRASGGAKVQEPGAPAGQWTMLHDISLGGCYVETTTPLPPGARVDVLVHVDDVQVTAKGEVTVSHRLVGMGLKFTEMSPLNRQRMEHLIDTLIKSGAAEA